MSDKKKKITTKLSLDKKQTNNNTNPIEEMPELPKGKTFQIISTFIDSLFDNDKSFLNKSFSPSHKKQKIKIKQKEEIYIKTKSNKKKNKKIKINKSKEKNERNKSLIKIKKHSNTFKNNDLNINIGNNNKKIKNIKTLANARTPNYVIKKENHKNNKIVKRSESNVKTPCNKETIGDKMIREELAKEKKICAERLKIIKDHILSLRRKEEELARKMIEINKKENALTKKNTGIRENSDIELSQNQLEMISKENLTKNNSKDEINNIKMNFLNEKKLEKK